jgi:signal transduction histidine kinase
MLGGFALPLVFAAVVVVSALETRTVTATLEEIRTRLRPRAEAAYEIEINVFEVAAAVLGYLADPDTIKFNTFAQKRRQLDSAVATYARFSASPGDPNPSVVQRLRELVAPFDSASVALVNQRRLGGFSSLTAERAARARYRALRDRVDTLLDRQIQPEAIDQWHAEAELARRASQMQNRVIVVVAILGITIAILAGAFAARAYAGLQRARERAELSSRQKSEFASLTAHELRSPLTAVLGSLQLLKSGRAGPLPDEAIRYLELSSRSTAELLQLINELLELDRIEAGMMPFAKGRVECSDLLRAARDGLVAMADDLGVTLHAECIANRALLGDPVRLRQVLTNFISNAIKHAPKGTRVDVRAEDRGDHVRVTVADSGPGIAAQDRERIFHRFVQTGSASSRHASTGLGLAIAREIVLRHDGRLGVDSEPGRGASFWFEIPTADQP